MTKEKHYSYKEIKHRSKAELSLWHDHVTSAMLSQASGMLQRIQELREKYSKSPFSFLRKSKLRLLDFIEFGDINKEIKND